MTHLYTLDLPGGKPQRLTNGSAHDFSRLVAGWQVPRLRDLVERRRAALENPGSGRNTSAIVEVAAVYSNPALSPDGTKSSCFAATPMTGKTAPSTAARRRTPTSSGFPRTAETPT